MKRLLFVVLMALPSLFASAQKYEKVAGFKSPYAFQAVAVDKDHFYAIENTHIAKYTMAGDSVTTWHIGDKEKIRHLNSGIVIKGKLYCAHSNYPKYPMASSIEIFDTKTMKHLESISFGIDTGSCTWVLPGKNCWYVFFAHYNADERKTKSAPDRANLSQLVKYDKKWRKQEAWIVPQALLDEVQPSSLSGAVLVGDTFYCTGHDAQKVYLLKVPEYGVQMEWVGEIEVPFIGQGISMDKDGNLWGIIRKDKLIIKSSLVRVPIQ